MSATPGLIPARFVAQAVLPAGSAVVPTLALDIVSQAGRSVETTLTLDTAGKNARATAARRHGAPYRFVIS